MNKPYIGVTGFTSRAQVSKVLSAMPRQSSHLLMVGVLVSNKTLIGETDKWPMRNPKISGVPNIFPNDQRTLNLVHYHTTERENLANQLEMVMAKSGPNCHGFQLNVTWPDKAEMEKFRRKFPGKKIVLQIGQRAMDKLDNSPIRIANKVKEYEGLAEYFLIDGSGGKGLKLNPNRSKNFLFYLQKAMTGMNPGLAGGLGPDSLNLLNHVLEEFPDLSIDAEGQLRNLQTDVMSTRKTRKYLIRSLELMKKD